LGSLFTFANTIWQVVAADEAKVGLLLLVLVVQVNDKNRNTVILKKLSIAVD
jgi:hypothetical protein